MESTIIVSIISAASAIVVTIMTIIAMISSAKITSRQKENELIIKNCQERLDACQAKINNMASREKIYLDMLKEWTGKPKKHILADVEKKSRN